LYYYFNLLLAFLIVNAYISSMRYHLIADKALMLLPVDGELSEKLCEHVCSRFNLPLVKVGFFPRGGFSGGVPKDILGNYGNITLNRKPVPVIHLFGAEGAQAECLIHELAHHLAHKRRVKVMHGRDFVRAYFDVLAVAKPFLSKCSSL